MNGPCERATVEAHAVPPMESEGLSGCGTFQPREETNGDDVSRDIVAGST